MAHPAVRTAPRTATKNGAAAPIQGRDALLVPYPPDEPPEPEIQPGKGAFSPEERAQVLTLIRSGRGRNEIAALTGRGRSTVSRVAKEAGLTFGDFVPAPVLTTWALPSGGSLRQEQAALAQESVAVARRLMAAMTEPVRHLRVSRKTGQIVVTVLPEPSPAERRDLMVGWGIAMSQISNVLNAGGGTDSRAAILTLVESLRATVEAEDDDRL